MGIKILVLILATSLLGGAPACLCKGHGRPEPKKTSCGHCPTKQAPERGDHSSSRCCCMHADADRASEREYSVQQVAFSADLDLLPEAVGHASLGQIVQSIPLAERDPKRPRLLLHLLFRHLAI